MALCNWTWVGVDLAWVKKWKFGWSGGWTNSAGPHTICQLQWEICRWILIGKTNYVHKYWRAWNFKLHSLLIRTCTWNLRWVVWTAMLCPILEIYSYANENSDDGRCPLHNKTFTQQRAQTNERMKDVSKPYGNFQSSTYAGPPEIRKPQRNASNWNHLTKLLIQTK